MLIKEAGHRLLNKCYSNRLTSKEKYLEMITWDFVLLIHYCETVSLYDKISKVRSEPSNKGKGTCLSVQSP